jgi:hypothetical protein
MTTRNLAVLLAAALAVPASAHAQATAQPRSGDRPAWRIEFHGGFQTGAGGSGSGQLPLPGAAFVTARNQLESRRVSSWFFGDGAALFNQSSQASVSPGRITPLDPVLTAASANTGGGFSGGITLTRPMTDRVALNISFDIAPGAALTDAALNATETTRRSFETGFDALVSHFGSDAQSIEATASIDATAGIQLGLGASLDVDLASVRAIVAYLSVGGGYLTHVGGAPEIALAGEYRFLAQFRPPDTLVHERDAITVRYSIRGSPFVLIGGGVRRDIGARAGLDLGVRVVIRQSNTRIAVSTQGETIGGEPSGVASFDTLPPGLQFSSDSTVPSNLSAPAIAGFETFTGSGRATQVRFTVGVYFRL